MELNTGDLVEVGGGIVSVQEGIIHKLTTSTAHVVFDDGRREVFRFRSTKGVWACKFSFWTIYILCVK